VVLDLRGKFGILTKSVFVDATTPAIAPVDPIDTLTLIPPEVTLTNPAAASPLYSWVKPLTVRATLPQRPAVANGMENRSRNMQLALADRQAVFKGECAKCHVEPAAGKTDLALYQAACGICHDSHNRASMVPDLRALKHPTDRDHWLKWITFGRPGSLMPAFAQSEGGPLTEEQIDSLVSYLDKSITQRAKAIANRPPPVLPPPPPAFPNNR
jgi:mono/diheme cytochrome c family protein